MARNPPFIRYLILARDPPLIRHLSMARDPPFIRYLSAAGGRAIRYRSRDTHLPYLARRIAPSAVPNMPYQYRAAHSTRIGR
eukprot:184367-Rhodomonas_salina.1